MHECKTLMMHAKLLEMVLKSDFNPKLRVWMSSRMEVIMGLSIIWRVCQSDAWSLRNNALKWMRSDEDIKSHVRDVFFMFFAYKVFLKLKFSFEWVLDPSRVKRVCPLTTLAPLFLLGLSK